MGNIMPMVGRGVWSLSCFSRLDLLLGVAGCTGGGRGNASSYLLRTCGGWVVSMNVICRGLGFM